MSRLKQPLIVQGFAQPLSVVAFHHDAPLQPYVMMDQALCLGAGARISIHHITELPADIPACGEVVDASGMSLSAADDAVPFPTWPPAL